jgi:hypothetical protein
MEKIASFRDVIDLWPSRSSMAADAGVSLMAVHNWWRRDQIPGKYDAALIDAASQKNIPLHWRQLMDLRSVRACPNGNRAA